MRVLVTGATGFVGSRVCGHLKDSGHEVLCVVHNPSTSKASNDEYVVDITDPAAFGVLDQVAGLGAVVHCAGLAHRFGRTAKREYQRVNVDGLRNVAEFAAGKGISRFIHLSSVLVYGPASSAEPVTEKHPLRPNDDYSASKVAGENVAAAICSQAGIDLTILRPTPILGEGSRGNVSRLIRALDKNRFIWIGDGRNKRSFVSVDDVARTVEMALHLDGGLCEFNVVGGTLSVRELVEIIANRLGTEPPKRLIPNSLAKAGLAATAPAGVFPAIARLRRTLDSWLADAVYSGDSLKQRGFTPRTSVQDALQREVDFYLSNKP